MYSVDDNADCIPNIDEYITSAIPGDECKWKDLVLLLQQHKHSSYADVIEVIVSIFHILIAMIQSYLTQVTIPSPLKG